MSILGFSLVLLGTKPLDFSHSEVSIFGVLFVCPQGTKYTVLTVALAKIISKPLIELMGLMK